MVQIIEENRRPTFSEQIGAETRKFATQIPEMMKLRRENQALEDLGLNVKGITNPQTRQQIIADQLAFGRKLKQAQNEPDLQSFTNQLMGMETVEPTSKGPEVQEEVEDVLTEKPAKRIAKKSPRLKKKISAETEEGGQLPQAETTGQVRQIFTPEEIAFKADQLQKENLRRGKPITKAEALATINQLNQLNANYNASVEQDRQKRQQAQRQYGDIAEAKLRKLDPNANDDVVSWFRKKGEQYASQNKSEAEIEKELSKDARLFKNKLSDIRNSVPAPRLGPLVKEAFKGTSKTFEQRKADVLTKLNPLLEDGLYETARGLLSELGYGPEESESILDNLGASVKSELGGFKKIGKPLSKEQIGMVPRYEEYKPEDRERFSESLQNVLMKNPNANLVLLRKEYEDKGVDWRLFKDSLNELIENGLYEPDKEMFYQLDILDQPPLNNLTKLLHSLNLVGR